ncbi:unnamed protein product [marine sediment metagenome]|uniref:Uncharacterized protein n=1 Tax=marine sediment metagenome TaxID=412755 RepID=X0VPA7_9ZZZZ
MTHSSTVTYRRVAQVASAVVLLLVGYWGHGVDATNAEQTGDIEAVERHVLVLEALLAANQGRILDALAELRKDLGLPAAPVELP